MGTPENLIRKNDEDFDHPDLDAETAGAFVLSEEGEVAEIKPRNPKEFYGGQKDEKDKIIIAQRNSLEKRINHIFSEISAAVHHRSYLEEKLDDFKRRFEEICQRIEMAKRRVVKMNKDEQKGLERERLDLLTELKVIIEEEIPIEESRIKKLVDNLNIVLERIDQEIEAEK